MLKPSILKYGHINVSLLPWNFALSDGSHFLYQDIAKNDKEYLLFNN